MALTEKGFEVALLELIENESRDGSGALFAGARVESFAEAGVLTRDAGVEVTLAGDSDTRGNVFRVTIQRVR